MLGFYLVDNPLTTNDPNDCRAVPQHKRTATMEDIVEMILHRSVGMSRSEIISVLDELGIAMEFFIKRGEKISTPLFNISYSVGGVFTDSKDTFDLARHEVRINLKPGSRLLTLAPTLKAEKLKAAIVLPILDSIEDITAGTFDETITPGQPLRIVGENLKLDPTDENQGVYFIETATKTETKATVFVDNQPKKLTVVAPALPQGEYEMVVKCMIGNGVKEGIYQGILSVV